MATPVIESTSTNTAAGSATVTINTPSGTTDGDLLLAVLKKAYEFNSAGVVNDESGWTTIASISDDSGRITYKAMYKTASSEGASYTFDSSSAVGNFGGIVYRISGWDTGSPAVSQAGLVSTTSSPSITVSNDPFTADALLIAVTGSFNSAGGITDITGVTISGTNPTWTTDFTVSDSVDARVETHHATATSASEITSLAWSSTGSGTSHFGSIISIEAVTNGDGNVNSVTLNLSAQAVDQTGTSTASITSASVSLQAEETTSETVNPTVWTTTSKS